VKREMPPCRGELGGAGTQELQNTRARSLSENPGSASPWENLRQALPDSAAPELLTPEFRNGCQAKVSEKICQRCRLAKACCEMSRRDGAIVAWHEVPGTASLQKSRPVGYGVIRGGLWRIHRWYLARTVHYIEQQLEHQRTRTFQEEYLAFLKKHGAHFDEKYLWD
jgi:hypothetical protein